MLQWLLGESPEVVQRQLAREELKRVLEEGHEAGILRPAQRSIAQGLFAVAKNTVRKSMTPAPRALTVREGTLKEEVLRLARRHQVAFFPVISATSPGQPVGYVRVVDLLLSERNTLSPIRPLIKIQENEPHITALVQLQGNNAPLAKVVDAADRTIGYITAAQLRGPLLKGGN
jgi:CBS domain containing-hemolysin-like protein